MRATPIEVDHIVLVCNGCRTERTVYPDRALMGAQELIDWLQAEPAPCECGAKTCDVKAHIRNMKESIGGSR